MKRIVALALCLVMVLGLMTGCQKRMDAETLYKKMGEAVQAADTYGMDAELDMDMKMSTMGMTISMGMDMDMNIRSKADGSAYYADMTMAIEALGEREETKLEMYGTVVDGDLVYYIYEGTEDMWVKTVQTDYAEMMGGLLMMQQDLTDVSGANLSLARGKQIVNGKNCYVLTEKIDGAEMQEELSDYVSQSLLQMDTTGLDEASMAELEALMQELDWSKLSGECVYYVDTESCLPLEMSVTVNGMGDVYADMIDAMMEMLAEETEEEIPEFTVEVPTFVISTRNMTYNEEAEVPAVPQEAIDNAIDADALTDDTVDDGSDYSDISVSEPLDDGRYLMTLGGTSVKVAVPAGYAVYMADAECVASMTEDMMNSLDYIVVADITSEDVFNAFIEEIVWAQTEGYYLSHSDVVELDGFQTASLIYNDNTSLWYAWKELDGGVLMVGAEIEGETFDLASLIAGVEIIAG